MSSSSTTATTTVDLTDSELEIYNTERLKMFRITIAICIVYGLLALIFLLVGLFTSFGAEYIFNKMFYFSTTYIIGTIIIIFYLSNTIYNFKFIKPSNSLENDRDLCPDYWKLVPENIDDLTDNNNKKYLPEDININLFKYKCVIDDSIISRNNIKINNPNYFISSKEDNIYTELSDDKKFDKTTLNKEGNEETYNNFKKYASIMNGYSYDNNGLKNNNNNSLKKQDNTFYKNNDPVPVVCDKLYPMYLSSMDADNKLKNPSDNNNKFRCAYSNTCKIPWTDAGCY